MTEEIRASDNCDLSQSRNGIVGLSGEMLADARSMQLENVSYSVPIAQLSTLGAGVSSLFPAFRTATQTMAADVTGLYRLANAGVGDTLKVAKDGNFWGAFKRTDGSSKFVKLQSADPLIQTSTVTLPIDPATMMMTAALFSIEQKLGDIEAIVVALDEDNQNTLKRYAGYDKDSGYYILEYENEARYPGKTIKVRSFQVQGVARHVIKSL